MVQPAVKFEVSYPSITGWTDLTSDARSFFVERGSSFDWASGTFRLVNAIGQIVLSTKSGNYDRLGGFVLESDYDAPLPFRFTLGTEIRWRGIAIARPIVRLTEDPELVWVLRGTYWQNLRRRQVWQQNPLHSTVENVVTDMITSGGAGALAGASVRYPTGPRLEAASSIGTLAQNLNAAALATGSLAAEGIAGGLGLFDLHTLGVATAAVDGQTIDDGSYIERLPVAAERVLLLGSPRVLSDASATLVSATRTSPASTTPIRLRRTYPWPSDAIDVEWGDPVAGNSNTTITADSFEDETETDPGGNKVTHVEVQAATSVVGQSIVVDFPGVVKRIQGYDSALIKEGTPDLATAEQVKTVAWIDFGHADNNFNSQERMLGITQRPLLDIQLVIPLWNDSANNPVPLEIEPGNPARFHAGPVDVSCLPVLKLGYRWQAGTIPRAIINGIGTSETATTVTVGTTLWDKNLATPASALPNRLDEIGNPSSDIIDNTGNITFANISNGYHISGFDVWELTKPIDRDVDSVELSSFSPGFGAYGATTLPLTGYDFNTLVPDRTYEYNYREIKKNTNGIDIFRSSNPYLDLVRFAYDDSNNLAHTANIAIDWDIDIPGNAWRSSRYSRTKHSYDEANATSHYLLLPIFAGHSAYTISHMWATYNYNDNIIVPQDIYSFFWTFIKGELILMSGAIDISAKNGELWILRGAYRDYPDDYTIVKWVIQIANIDGTSRFFTISPDDLGLRIPDNIFTANAFRPLGICVNQQTDRVAIWWFGQTYTNGLPSGQHEQVSVFNPPQVIL